MRPSPSLSLRIRAHITHPDAPRPRAPVQSAIPAAYYRGGTSRGVFFQPQHLPQDRAKWPSLFRQVMGSGDPYARQLDGMGAGISSLSKICLVEPHGTRTVVPKQAIADRVAYQSLDGARQLLEHVAARGDAVGGVDIDYTFVGLGIESDEVDVAGNCGNMSSAIGPYAYNAGLLPPRTYAKGNGPVTVTIRNTNTGKLIHATFDVAGGQAAVVGDYSIDGVTGPGAKIKLDFKHPYGSKTGKVLPTGNKVDRILDYNVTCVDGANPCIFIRASDVGVDGTVLPNDFNKLPDKLALLERIRKAAAVAMGIAPTEDAVPRTVPKIGLISMSSTHPVLSGQTLQTSQTDLVVRFLSDTQPHRAIPLTAALTTAVAARIPGTLVEQILAPDPVMDGAITIGHASGRLQVDATMDDKDKLTPINGTVYRTAKRLFEGSTFWTEPTPNAPAERALRSVYGTNGTHSLGMAFVLESRGQSTKQLWAEEPERVKSSSPLPIAARSLHTDRTVRSPSKDSTDTPPLSAKATQWRQWAKRHSKEQRSLRSPAGQRARNKEAKGDSNEENGSQPTIKRQVEGVWARDRDTEETDAVLEEMISRDRAREERWSGKE
ncbi:hypothetical protein N0V95_007399 [Ascochyta clinopodiicola]|nr:hypothetical protein N0V95_007399 [Ascochyta clinopodiicola]